MSSLAQLLENRSSQYRHACMETNVAKSRHTVLARLYAATQRLSVSIKEHNTAEALIEIGSNLMACEEMAVLQIEPKSKSASFLATVGLTKSQRTALSENSARIAEAVEHGRVCIPEDKKQGNEFLVSLGITALVPLWQNRETKGAIVFFNLLPQRNGLDEGDLELLELLAVYAGPCLFNTDFLERKALG